MGFCRGELEISSKAVEMSELRSETSAVAFIDFLGFSSALRSGDDETLERIYGLMMTVVSIREAFQKSYYDSKETLELRNCRPQMTIFSDSIVLSYGLERYAACGPYILRAIIGLAIYDILSYIALIAANAAAHGFLLRAGIAVGMMHHSNDAVFGEALEHAYYIESREADFPRAMFRGEKYRPETSGNLIEVDYLERMVSLLDDAKGWYQIVNKHIERGVASNSDRISRNWRWFAEGLRKYSFGEQDNSI